jgi:hypothetical protein
MQRSPNPLPPRPFGPCGPPSPHTRFPSSLSLLGGPALSAQPRAPALPLPRGPGLPAACPHPPFAQYPVPPPPPALSWMRPRRASLGNRPRARPIFTPCSPRLATSICKPHLAHPLSPARARAPPGELPALSRSSATTSHHAGPCDRTTLESHHRLAWSHRCIHARSPPAPPEVRIVGHLFFLRLCVFAGEGWRWCFVIVPRPFN